MPSRLELIKFMVKNHSNLRNTTRGEFRQQLPIKSIEYNKQKCF